MAHQNHLSLHRAAMFALVVVACNGEVTTDEAGQGVTLTITPAAARVGPGESLALTASVTGTAVTLVDWYVQEGSAGGSVESDGWYTAPTTNGTYHVVAVSRADARTSAAATVTVSGSAPTGSGAPMNTANRTSGVAPLAVFFDAVDDVARSFNPGVPASETTFTWASGVVQPADKEGTNYSWNFGDLRAGVWTQTGFSRNAATGYTAGHVYETPGTYVVTLTVTQPNGIVNTYQQTITVSAFAGTTGYASATGVGAAPGTEAAPTSLTNGIAWVKAATNRRLLLKRGDAFTIAGISLNGGGSPGIIGAYGSGAKPVINVTGTGEGISVQSNDWRVMDVLASGPGASSTGYGFNIYSHADNALFLRCDARNFRVGFGNDYVEASASTPPDGNFWVEGTADSTNTTNHMYVAGRRTAVMGNYLHDQPLSHLFRTPELHKGVIAHNRLWNPGPTRGAIKLGGRSVTTAFPRTKYVVVSDNLIRGDTWTISISPQNTVEDERLTHVVVERNRFWSTASVSSDIVLEAQHVMIRNNVFDATDSSSTYKAVFLMTRCIGPGLAQVRILNNTIVQRNASAGIYVAEWESSPIEDSPNVTIANNILYAPLTSSVALYLGTPDTSYSEANNLVNVNPGFTDFPNGDYTLAAGGNAVDRGGARGDAREDFTRVARPLGGAPDIGAYESH